MGFTNTGLKKRFAKNITFCVLAVFCLSAFLIVSCENPLMEGVWGLKIITFETNGGTAVPVQKLLRGEKVTKPGNPSKEGYDFGGWYEDNEVFEYEWDFNDSPTEAMTLYAKWEAAGSVYYTLILDTEGLDSRDSVSFADSASLETGAFNGSTVSINYSLAETDDTITELRFNISDNRIFTADQPGSGVFDYVVKNADAEDGTITIRAVSIHTDLIPLDAPTGVSFNSNGGISFTTGDNNGSAGAAFMFTLYKNSEPVPLFSNISIESGGGSFPGLRSEMLKEAGAYSVRVWAQTSNPAYLSPSIAAVSNSLNVLSLIINTDDLTHNDDFVSFNESDAVKETTAFNGSSVIIYYKLDGSMYNNLLGLYIDGEKKYETEIAEQGQYNYTVDSADADNWVITIHAQFDHSNKNILHPPEIVDFDKTGKIIITNNSSNPASTTYKFTLYNGDSIVDYFTDMQITSGNVPANIVNKMLENTGDYHVKVWAVTDEPDYESSSGHIDSVTVHVYQVSVNINGAETGDKITVNGTDYINTFSLNAFAGDTVTLDAKPGSGRMVTWSDAGSGTGNTRTVNVTGPTNVTAAFAVAPVTVTVGSVITGYATLTFALAYVSENTGSFVVKVAANQTLAPYQVTKNITLIANNPLVPVTITLSGNGSLFTLISGGVLTLDNGILLKGHDNNNTQLVVVLSGSEGMIMNDGSEISGNSGGGVYNFGKFTMNGGKIINNSRSGNGGGVLNENSAIFTMNGGEINNNTASAGGGVYNSGTLNLGGTAKIHTNFDSNMTSSNLYLVNDKYITLNTSPAPAAGMEIYARTATSNGVIIQSGATASHAQYFRADESGKVVVHESGQIKILKTGSGTTDDPFLIYNETDLRKVGTNQAHNGGAWSLSAYYELTANITLTQGNWTPIGTETYPFAGWFDGSGYTVSNLTITDSALTGFFGSINDGYVENLHLQIGSAGINGKNYTGGIAGQIKSAYIDSCSVSGGSVSTNNLHAGGIAGYVISDSVIQNCYTTSNVISTSGNSGGIVGYLYANSSVTNCYTSGTISGIGATGGIAGDVFNNSKIEYCVALNPAIVKLSGDGVLFGRISGHIDSSSAVSNKARSDMPVNGAAVTGGTSTNKDGQNISVGAGTTLTSVFSTDWDTGIWNIPPGNLVIDGELPTLKNIPAGTHNPALQRAVYNIGNKGPAGGIIFYHDPNGFTVQGYGSIGDEGYFETYTAYYLEAAPADASESTIKWSNTNLLIPGLSQNSDDTTDRAIGRGRLNTALIAAAHSADTPANNAAKAAAAYTNGGKNDWFLPSREEQNQIYIQRSPVGITTTGMFWSSSQYITDTAWSQTFNGGNWYNDRKEYGSKVRAIRAF